MSKILITGGAGFIGSHLAERCIHEGDEVIVIDNLSRGRVENISKIRDQIEFYNQDLLHFRKLSPIIKKSDAIFHLAALSRVIPSIENPGSCFVNNIQATELIARICSKYHKKLIFSSSREVYGPGLFFPINESHPLNPENPYGTSKVVGENIIQTYAKCYNLKYGILRLANVYGPRDFDRVIPTFINNCLKHKDLTPYGGSQIIDFIFVDDVVDAFYRSIDIKDNFIVNIGSGKGRSILKLAKIVCKLTKSQNKIILREKRKGEVEKFIADNKKAKEILKWSPKTSFKKGFGITLKSYTGEI